MLLKTKLKLIVFIAFCVFIACSVCAFYVKPVSKNMEFNSFMCKNGYEKKWSGACVCDSPLLFSGKYCTEEAIKSCSSNSDCPKHSYCLSINNQGSCFNASIRGSIRIDNADYVLSDSLLSYNNASNFCSVLGKDFHPASRMDLGCNGESAACMDKNIIIKIQDKFGIIGFFWLDELPNSQYAYYADLNDGTVYHTKKDNFEFSQVLCVRKR